jgi:uncharacterized membrane protein (DUF4010 family)
MKKEFKFFDDPENVRKFRRVFYMVCVVLLIVDLVVPKHGYFFWENWPGFYAAYGFVACVSLVLAAKHILRRIVKRREDYYD